MAYLMIAEKQFENGKYAGWYNIGPDDCDCFQTGALVNLFVRNWGKEIQWINMPDSGHHEANFLKLDCSKLKSVFQWNPRWHLDTAVEKTVEWYKVWAAGEDVENLMVKQIAEYLVQR